MPIFNNSQYIPTVSTMGSFLTMAFLFAILITPMANVTVTTIGKPSGIAATAKLIKYMKKYYLPKVLT